MNREWAELNKTMQLQIKKKETFVGIIKKYATYEELL